MMQHPNVDCTNVLSRTFCSCCTFFSLSNQESISPLYHHWDDTLIDFTTRPSINQWFPKQILLLCRYKLWSSSTLSCIGTDQIYLSKLLLSGTTPFLEVRKATGRRFFPLFFHEKINLVYSWYREKQPKNPVSFENRFSISYKSDSLSYAAQKLKYSKPLIIF